MLSVTEFPITSFLTRLRWLDGKPLHVEPYRVALFRQFFDEVDAAGRLRYNLALLGRAKKNNKTLDLCLASMWAAMADDVRGSQVFIVANDVDQAADDLDLLKKLIRANPDVLGEYLTLNKKVIERRDGGGAIEVLPANDIAGAHGKSYRLLGIDEIHGYKTYDLLEALAPDPHRDNCQQWITSYASIYHKQGVPLHDMVEIGKAGSDPRMLFSWYSANYCTDPALADLSPEQRANPSMASWPSAGYLDQQRRRLPTSKYRRLHLNLPGAPEGAAYDADMVSSAIDRTAVIHQPMPGVGYAAFVDMSGGSNDDAVLAIGHKADDLLVLDLVLDQGRKAPFDPNAAVSRFVRALRQWGISRVTGDRYAGETFKRQFENARIRYKVADRSAAELYEDFEPHLNGGRVVLLNSAKLESQLLGLVWKGARIDHDRGEHDDYANAVAGLMVELSAAKRKHKATWGSSRTSGLAPHVRAAFGRRIYGSRQDAYQQTLIDREAARHAGGGNAWRIKL